jgi:phospholipid/cholesterol/gamma-HCH transport system substrate-binding protein
MGRNVIETVLGAVVLLVAGLFMAFAFKSADLKKVQGYGVTALFQRADGLKNGSDVMVNGVKVGTVVGQELVTDPGRDQFYVRVRLSIDPKVILPADTVATIANESLLGGRYLSLEIGAEEDNIKTDGTGRITHTQPPIRLDDLIGKLLFSSKTESKKEPPKTDPADHP